MTTINISVFDGMQLGVSPTQLAPTAALDSRNTLLEDGSLQPVSRPRVHARLSTAFTFPPQTLFSVEGSYYGTQFYYHVFRYNAGDKNEALVILTSPAESPKVIHASTFQSFLNDFSQVHSVEDKLNILGIPRPTGGLVLGTSSGAPSTPETRSYTFTYVNELGWESAPSLPVTIDVPANSVVTFSGAAVIPFGYSGVFTISKLRIYRTVAGTNTSDFQFIREVVGSVFSGVDDVTARERAEVLTTTWSMPRNTDFNIWLGEQASGNDNLHHIVQLPGGFLAGASRNRLCFSEPYVPYAWPREYELTVNETIVGLGVFGNSVVVLTDGFAYVASGAAPESMALQQLDVYRPCLSRRSIVSTGSSVLYASTDGIVEVSARGARLVTEGFISPSIWRAFFPDSMKFVYANGRLHVFYSGASVSIRRALMNTEVMLPINGVLIFPIGDDYSKGMSYVHLDADAVAAPGMASDSEYILFIGRMTDPVTVYTDRWLWLVDFLSNDTPMEYEWQSRPFVLPSHTNLSVVQVKTTGPISIGVRGYSGSLTSPPVYNESAAVDSNTPVRLPAGNRYDYLVVTVRGTSRVEQVTLASSMEELRQVS